MEQGSKDTKQIVREDLKFKCLFPEHIKEHNIVSPYLILKDGTYAATTIGSNNEFVTPRPQVNQFKVSFDNARLKDRVPHRILLNGRVVANEIHRELKSTRIPRNLKAIGDRIKEVITRDSARHLPPLIGRVNDDGRFLEREKLIMMFGKEYIENLERENNEFL